MVAVTVAGGRAGRCQLRSYSRALDFMHEVPKYKAKIQSLGRQDPRAGRADSADRQTRFCPTAEDKKTVTVKQSSNWTDMVSRNANSVSELVLALTFIPFLVFFMLSWQDHVRSATVMLFSMENRNSAYVMLGLIARMIRSFIVGNFIIGVFHQRVQHRDVWRHRPAVFLLSRRHQRLPQPDSLPRRAAGGAAAAGRRPRATSPPESRC